MNDAQCLALRDLIIASTFPANEHGYAAPRFRYVAVVRDGDCPRSVPGDATVLYHYLPAAWERAGAGSDADAFIRGLLNQSPFHAKSIRLEHRPNSWDALWSIAAVSPSDNMPTLVLIEKPDRSVEGVVMREVGTFGSHATLADTYPEPGQAQAALQQLVELEPYAPFLRWYKESNIAASTLDEACTRAPQSPQGQKFVIVYRRDEWLWGIWNNPGLQHYAGNGSLVLSSVADFHGSRVSMAKRATRPGLDDAKGRQTIVGDGAALERALALAKMARSDEPKFGEYESHPGVKALCAWWNAAAPDNMRTAGCFRLYAWDDAKQIFLAGDPEEPAMQADVLADGGAYAIFEREGRPTIAAQFYRGREFNQEQSGGSIVFSASGIEAYDVGLNAADMDEAYYSARGLCAPHVQAFAGNGAQ